MGRARLLMSKTILENMIALNGKAKIVDVNYDDTYEHIEIIIEHPSLPETKGIDPPMGIMSHTRIEGRIDSEFKVDNISLFGTRSI